MTRADRNFRMFIGAAILTSSLIGLFAEPTPEHQKMGYSILAGIVAICLFELSDWRLRRTQNQVTKPGKLDQ